MGEFFVYTLAEKGVELGFGHEAEAIERIAHPMMGLQILGSLPVVDIGVLDEGRSAANSRGELAFLAVPAGDVAGKAEGPLAGFGRRNADNVTIAAIPKGLNQVGLVAGRAELAMQLEASRIIGGGLENEIAGGPLRRLGARRLGRRKL